MAETKSLNEFLGYPKITLNQATELMRDICGSLNINLTRDAKLIFPQGIDYGIKLSAMHYPGLSVDQLKKLIEHYPMFNGILTIEGSLVICFQ